MDEEMEAESQEWIAQRRKERSRYVFGQLFWAAIFAASIFASDYILSHYSASLWTFIAIALPVIAATFWAWMIYSHIRKLEEFERSIAVNAFAMTFGLLLWAITCYALVAESLNWPSLPIFLLAPVAVILWQALWETLRRKYL